MTNVGRKASKKKGTGHVAEEEKAAPDRRPASLRTPVPGGHPYAPARITLPRWYVERLDEEARLLGYTRRKDFLNMLVRRKAGLGQYARSADAPKVKLPLPEKVGQTEEYIWHIPIELKLLLDRLLDQMGGMPAKAWVVMNLHEWLGLPINPSISGRP